MNFALGHGGTVKLDPTVTYTIYDSLLIPSQTSLDGNGATLKLAKGLSTWGGRNASISQKKAILMIKNNQAEYVSIKNLIVDGSQSDYYPTVRLGTSCYNMATLIGCKNLNIENCTFKNGCNDAILLSGCTNVDIDRITVNKCGHDCISTYYVDNITVKNCTFINRTNSSVRLYNVTDGRVLNCKTTTSGGGYTGVELQGNLKNCLIKGNYIKGLPYPGIVSLSAKMRNVIIENNIIEKCKSPGISAKGAILVNNKII